jgi:hypothetical protein
MLDLQEIDSGLPLGTKEPMREHLLATLSEPSAHHFSPHPSMETITLVTQTPRNEFSGLAMRKEPVKTVKTLMTPYVHTFEQHCLKKDPFRDGFGAFLPPMQCKPTFNSIMTRQGVKFDDQDQISPKPTVEDRLLEFNRQIYTDLYHKSDKHAIKNVKLLPNTILTSNPMPMNSTLDATPLMKFEFDEIAPRNNEVRRSFFHNVFQTTMSSNHENRSVKPGPCTKILLKKVKVNIVNKFRAPRFTPRFPPKGKLYSLGMIKIETPATQHRKYHKEAE